MTASITSSPVYIASVGSEPINPEWEAQEQLLDSSATDREPLRPTAHSSATKGNMYLVHGARKVGARIKRAWQPLRSGNEKETVSGVYENLDSGKLEWIEKEKCRSSHRTGLYDFLLEDPDF